MRALCLHRGVIRLSHTRSCISQQLLRNKWFQDYGLKATLTVSVSRCQDSWVLRASISGFSPCYKVSAVAAAGTSRLKAGRTCFPAHPCGCSGCWQHSVPCELVGWGVLVSAWLLIWAAPSSLSCRLLHCLQPSSK